MFFGSYRAEKGLKPVEMDKKGFKMSLNNYFGPVFGKKKGSVVGGYRQWHICRKEREDAKTEHLPA